ncbi:hypothetical protein SAVIM40S_01224 [Streptomyces avidinii]
MVQRAATARDGCAAAAQYEQGHVVPAARVPDQVAQHVGEFLHVDRAAVDRRHEFPHAGVPFRTGAFDQAVGAQQQGVPGVQFEAGDGIAGAGAGLFTGRQAERQPAGRLDPVDAAVTAPHDRVEMPGADHPGHPGGQVHLGVGAGGEPFRLQFAQEGGGPCHRRPGGVALHDVGTHHDAQLPHDGRRVRVVALDVADHHPDPAVAERDHVVPVAADVPPHPGGAVPHGDQGPRHLRDPAGQHGPLESLGKVVLLFEEHGALEALRDTAAECHQQVPLLGGEIAVPRVEEPERPDGPPLGDQRQVDAAADGQGLDVRPQLRVAPLELPARHEEDRLHGAYGLAHGQSRIDPGVLDLRHVRAQLPLRDQVDAPAVDDAQHHADRAEVPEGLRVLEDVGHVVHGAGVGEDGGGPLDDVGHPAAPLDLLPGGAGLAGVVGGVAEDPDHAVRATARVPQDVPLDVGPGCRAVAPAAADVGPVVAPAVLDRLRDPGVEPCLLTGHEASPEPGGRAVELVRGQVQDLQGGGIEIHPPVVEVPVECAHAVEREAGVRPRRPVDGGVLRPTAHADRVSLSPAGVPAERPRRPAHDAPRHPAGRRAGRLRPPRPRPAGLLFARPRTRGRRTCAHRGTMPFRSPGGSRRGPTGRSGPGC